MFDWGFAIEVLPMLVKGLFVTLEATVAGSMFALLLGLVWTIMRRSSRAVLSWSAAFAVEFLRSTPLLVQLYFLYYVLPSFGVALSPFATGVVGIGLHYSAYMSEVYRAGIESVPRGQWEAARALGLTLSQTYLRIVFPQALPPITPVLGNYFIAMFKDTPMLSAITVVELLQTAKIVGSEHFRYLEPISLVGMLFLVLSLLTSIAVRVLERKVVSLTGVRL